MNGVVRRFDFDAGLGEIADEAGVAYIFHCASIADGTRNIAVDAEISFDPLPKLGRIEAANIRPR